MTAKDEGVTQAPAVARTVKDYFKEILEDVKGAKVTGWKVNKRDELVRLLEGYIRELEAAEAAWAGTKADGGLDVPKWT